MDDVTKNISGFTFATPRFNLDEVELLVSVWNSKFNLDCTIHKDRGKDQFIIYILTKSIPLFRLLVKPYFHESFIYKLNTK